MRLAKKTETSTRVALSVEENTAVFGKGSIERRTLADPRGFECGSISKGECDWMWQRLLRTVTVEHVLDETSGLETKWAHYGITYKIAVQCKASNWHPESLRALRSGCVRASGLPMDRSKSCTGDVIFDGRSTHARRRDQF